MASPWRRVLLSLESRRLFPDDSGLSDADFHANHVGADYVGASKIRSLDRRI